MGVVVAVVVYRVRNRNYIISKIFHVYIYVYVQIDRKKMIPTNIKYISIFLDDNYCVFIINNI